MSKKKSRKKRKSTLCGDTKKKNVFRRFGKVVSSKTTSAYNTVKSKTKGFVEDIKFGEKIAEDLETVADMIARADNKAALLATAQTMKDKANELEAIARSI